MQTTKESCKGCDCLKALEDMEKAKNAGYWKRRAKTLAEEIAAYVETDGRGHCVTDMAAKSLAQIIRDMPTHDQIYSFSGLSPFDYRALVDWMKDPNRKEAIHAFTAGPARDAGRAFEEYLREGK